MELTAAGVVMARSIESFKGGLDNFVEVKWSFHVQRLYVSGHSLLGGATVGEDGGATSMPGFPGASG